MFFLRERVRKIALILYEGFRENQIQLHSATLTYYTLLTLVPIFALLLLLAEQFQFESFMQRELLALFKDQPQISHYLIQFAHNALVETHATLFKVTGIALLIWAVLNMLSYIDIGINQIWHSKKKLSIVQRNMRFFVMLLVCPLLFVLSSATTLYARTLMGHLGEKGLFEEVMQMVQVVSNLFPSLLTFFLLSFIYYYVPYRKVSLRLAFLSGLITALIYQLVQHLYITLQISVASYSALYGTFAAIPLFLVWVHLSWMIFLVGAKLCYALSHSHS